MILQSIFRNFGQGGLHNGALSITSNSPDELMHMHETTIVPSVFWFLHCTYTSNPMQVVDDNYRTLATTQANIDLHIVGVNMCNALAKLVGHTVEFWLASAVYFY